MYIVQNHIYTHLTFVIVFLKYNSRIRIAVMKLRRGTMDVMFNIDLIIPARL